MLPLHWKPNIAGCISLLIVILLKYFGLTLLLGGIVKTARKSGSNSVIFYVLFIQETVLFRHKLLFARGQKSNLYFGKK